MLRAIDSMINNCLAVVTT